MDGDYQTIRSAASCILPKTGPTPVPTNENVHALTIPARVAKDAGLTLPSDLDELKFVGNTITDHADVIRDYAMQWFIGLLSLENLAGKYPEWLSLFTVSQGGRGPNNSNKALKAISNITPFFKSSFTFNKPWPVHKLPTLSEDAIPGEDSTSARVPDPWLLLVQTTIVHPDEHSPKSIRTFASPASKLGNPAPGTFGSAKVCAEGAMKTELPGAEYLDRTFFIRVIGSTSTRMGRVGQGEDANRWDHFGFYEDPKVAEEAKKICWWIRSVVDIVWLKLDSCELY